MLGALFTVAALFAQAAPDSAPAASPPASTAPATATASTPPPAHGVSGVTVTAKPKAKGDVDQKEVVCHSEAVLGSMFPKKVCASRGDIAERRNVDQAEVRRWTALRPGVGN
jgi:hypothetical protein